jgi:hypothetical protein
MFIDAAPTLGEFWHRNRNDHRIIVSDERTELPQLLLSWQGFTVSCDPRATVSVNETCRLPADISEIKPFRSAP